MFARVSTHSHSRGSYGAYGAAAGKPQPFDARRAKCSAGSDKEVLVSVIETAGAGIGSFNAWMHQLLTDLCASRQPVGLTTVERMSTVEPTPEPTPR